MRITNFEKVVNMEKDTATYTIEITTGRQHDYEGYDVFPDSELADFVKILIDKKFAKIKEERLNNN